MGSKKTDEIFEKIEILLKELKVICGSKNKPTIDSNKNYSTKARRSKKGIGPSKPLSNLQSQGFFNDYKTVVEVHAEFKKRALNISKEVISIALMRLVRRESLERSGSGTPKDPWKYKSK